MDKKEIVIVAAKRTPLGSMLGQLSSLSATQLGAIAHEAAIQEAGIDKESISEVISGCVLPAGLGQAPARQAAMYAGIPVSVGATTINKVCGSGMKAVMLACDSIQTGDANIVLASGMESMSNTPYLLLKGRQGYRLGHGALKDHLFLDGLEDAYEAGKLMGMFAEDTANFYHIDREAQDAYARESMELALRAEKNQLFAQEIVKVRIEDRKNEIIISKDEGPNEAKLAKISQLKPAFRADGTITAANSSSIADGAASLVLMDAKVALQRGIKPLARIVATASYATEPKWFTRAPVDAIRKVLQKAQWNPQEVDLYEINEAFAIVAMVAIQELELSREKVNIHGGACALGHPIGASGARILVTLLHALQNTKKRRGVASLCIGGGEATALALELC